MHSMNKLASCGNFPGTKTNSYPKSNPITVITIRGRHH